VNLAALKTVGVFAAVGAIIGDVLATLIAPRFLTWYNTPGAGTLQTICNIEQMSQQIFSQLIRAQLVGSGIGALALIAVGVVAVRRRSARAASSSPA
jgi:glycerol uptake facilitator-like aquaporin